MTTRYRMTTDVQVWQIKGYGGNPPEVERHILRILAGGGGPVKPGDWVVLTGKVLELLPDDEFRARCVEVTE